MKTFSSVFHLYRDAYSGLPKAAWMLSLVELVNRSGTMIFFFMTLYLTQEKGFNTLQAGQVMSVYGLGALIGAYLGGKFSDTIGAYAVQKISLFFTGVAMIVLGYLDSFILINVTMFLMAAISETLHPANATAMSQVCPAELRTKGFALNRLAANLGVSIGPVAGGFLAMINYRYLFWVDGVTCLLAGFLFFLFFKSRRPDPVSGVSSTGTEVAPWHNAYFMKLMLMVFILGLVFVQLFTTFPLYFRQYYGFQESRIGLLIAINTVMIVIFEMVLIHSLRKKTNIRLLALGSLLLCAGFALIPLGRGFGYAAITVAVWTVGEMLFMPAISTLIANHASDSVRGRYMGFFSLAFSLSFLVGPIAGTFVYQRLGPSYLWMIAGLIGLGLWLGFSLLKEKKAT